MRISDWSSDVCSSDLILRLPTALAMICCEAMMQRHDMIDTMRGLGLKGMAAAFDEAVTTGLQRKRTIMEILTDLLRAEATHRDAASIRYRRSEEHTSELQSLMRISYAVFCLKKTNKQKH